MNKISKAFVTFSQSHRHQIGEQVFDKDTVCVFEASTKEEARAITFKNFSSRWCFLYFEESWEEEMLEDFPKGYVNLVEQKSIISNEENLFTLFKIAKENGWENIPIFCNHILDNYLDNYYDLDVDKVILHNFRTYEDYNELSLNDLIGNFENNKVSFINSLFNYAANKEEIYNGFVAKLQIDILLPRAYDGCLLVQANWFSMPTSKRLDWFLGLFTPLIEHYATTKQL